MRYWLLVSALLFTDLIDDQHQLHAQTLDQQVNLFTIPNMSASFCRMPSRETSQGIDAVYSNPAGLTGLKDGFHFQINNQFQFIRKGMTSEYPAFNDRSSYYDYSLNNYTFPTLFTAWKHNRLAFSLGVFAAMGGGGGASFENLPSAELPLADMNNVLSGVLDIYDNYYHFDDDYSNIRYEYDFDSKGLAFSPGVQLSATYQISDRIAVSTGIRYVNYFSNAVGSASNIKVYNEQIGLAESPGDYLRYLQSTESEAITSEDIDLGFITIDGDELLTVLATAFDELIPESDIDIKQNGKGFTPIIGVQYNWKKRVYASFKYEHRTKILLRTQVFDEKDGDGLYVNGRVIHADLPGLMSLGIRYEANDKLTLASGHRTVFYKRADWNGRNEFVDRNFLEFTFSAEYDVHPNITISGGYTYSETKVEDAYQNEVDYVLPGHTFAIGAEVRITENVSLEGGLLNVIYNKQEFDKNYEPFAGRLDLPAIFDQTVHNEADGRVMIVAIGANISMPSSND